MSKISKELAKEAKKKGICESWYKELQTIEDKREMIAMYLKGIDFCLMNDYPSNDYIRLNFKDIINEFGIYLDDNFNVCNIRKCILLGSTKGYIEINNFNVSEIFVKNESILNITAKNNSFVMIDAFDNSKTTVKAQDNAKVCINKYGNATIDSIKNDLAIVKIIEKNKKIY
ncbi:MAG: hypothetical protein BWY38_01637 [Ignavibacteria bacterium ADurb.Bin266]|nr:MAG: hypothetical protein BWY38_01637 [Ignavibacteria bacterium ADurb.Bin266]